MNNQRDNNQMASWFKIVVLGVGVAGALYGAVRYMFGRQAEAGNYTISGNRRRRSHVVEVPQRECQVCSETSDEFVVFLPCMHSVACLDCAAIMRKCVSCKSVIAQRIAEDSNRVVPYKPPKLNDELSCPICCDNKKRIIFGCGHTVCRVCSEKVKDCPVCRETITSRKNFF